MFTYFLAYSLYRIEKATSKLHISKAIGSLKLGLVPLESYVSLLSARKKHFVTKHLSSRFSAKPLKFGSQNTLLSVTKFLSLMGFERKMKKLSRFNFCHTFFRVVSSRTVLFPARGAKQKSLGAQIQMQHCCGYSDIHDIIIVRTVMQK